MYKDEMDGGNPINQSINRKFEADVPNLFN